MWDFWGFGEGDIFLGIFCGKGCLTGGGVELEGKLLYANELELPGCLRKQQRWSDRCSGSRFSAEEFPCGN